MGDTWIIDITHYLLPDGELAEGPAGRIARYFGEIISAATASPTGEWVDTSVQCRRKPGRRPCPGHIRAIWRDNPDVVKWHCSSCDDNGVIRNWRGTTWDRCQSLHDWATPSSDRGDLPDMGSIGAMPQILSAAGWYYWKRGNLAEVAQALATEHVWPLERAQAFVEQHRYNITVLSEIPAGASDAGWERWGEDYGEVLEVLYQKLVDADPTVTEEYAEEESPIFVLHDVMQTPKTPAREAFSKRYGPVVEFLVTQSEEYYDEALAEAIARWTGQRS